MIDKCFEQLTNKRIYEDEFEDLCRRVSLTMADFMRMQTDEYIGGILESKAITYIQAKGQALS